MRVLISILVFCFIHTDAVGAELESCAKLTSAQGETCEKLEVLLDLSGCNDESDKSVRALVQCHNEEAVATYRSSSSNYRAVFKKRNAGWGKINYELEGQVWRHLRKKAVVHLDTASPNTKKIEVPEVPAPVVSKPATVIEPISAAPPNVPPVKKPSDEELLGLVNLFSGLTFKGSIDTYYAYNGNTPGVVPNVPTPANAQAQNKYHVFDVYHDDFQMSYAHLQIQKVSGPVTALVDLGYGPAMQIVSGTKTDSAQMNLKQAVIGYKLGDHWTLEAGRFVTYLGYETIESQDNLNYSRGVLFGYFVPFWHQGAKLTYAPNEQWSFMAMAADGWNNSYADKKQKTWGGQIAWNPNADVSFLLGFISGKDALPANINPDSPFETRTVYDFISTFKVNDSWSLAVNFDSYHFGPAKAWGVAGYAKYRFNEKWSLSSRVEYIDDKDNLALGENLSDGQKLSTYTLTLENKLSANLSMKVEGRLDQSTSAVFTKANNPVSSQGQGLLGLTLGF